MSVSVDHQLALVKIHEAWASIDDLSIKPKQKMRRYIEEVMSAPGITFKYILVTGYLAKCVEPQVNARALQTRSSLQGAYDARSLCHKVVVGFEKSKGNLFGLSNEPFVNKPARHPDHDKNNPQIKNRSVAESLHEALECANLASLQEVFAGLVHILRMGKERASEEIAALSAQEINLYRVIEFINAFLSTADGGARLVAVWAAFTKLLADEAIKVAVSSPNRPDLFAKSAGDVEVFYEGVLVSASECKHRALTIDDVIHGIRKAAERRCPEYLFVYAAGLAVEQKAAIEVIITRNSNRLDLAIIDIHEAAPALAAIMNPRRRAVFGSVVADFLRDMRRFDSANAAAELWNSMVR